MEFIFGFCVGAIVAGIAIMMCVGIIVGAVITRIAEDRGGAGAFMRWVSRP